MIFLGDCSLHFLKKNQIKISFSEGNNSAAIQRLSSGKNIHPGSSNFPRDCILNDWLICFQTKKTQQAHSTEAESLETGLGFFCPFFIFDFLFRKIFAKIISISFIRFRYILTKLETNSLF